MIRAFEVGIVDRIRFLSNTATLVNEMEFPEELGNLMDVMWTDVIEDRRTQDIVQDKRLFLRVGTERVLP